MSYRTRFFCDESGVSSDVGRKFISKSQLIENYPWMTGPNTSGSTLWTWGYRDSGRLGDNTTISRSSPVQTVSSGTDWQCVAAGFTHVLATKRDGTLWSWGNGVDGKLGNLSTINRSSPVQTISGGTNWKTMAGGLAHSVSIKTDGTLWGWGWNGWGQLGTNALTNQSSPVQTISAGTDWKQVSAGCRTSAAVKLDGSLWGWGFNSIGQQGTNNTVHRSSPVQTVSATTDWNNVQSSGYHTAAIKNNGSLWLWGRNYGYELGNGLDYVDRSSPVQTASSSVSWRQVSITHCRSAAITINRNLGTWGDGRNNGVLLGNGLCGGRYANAPTYVFFDTYFNCVSLGRDASAFIDSEGRLFSWGFYGDGALGNNKSCTGFGFQPSPVQTVAGGNNWRSLTLGGPNIIVAIRDEDE